MKQIHDVIFWMLISDASILGLIFIAYIKEILLWFVVFLGVVGYAMGGRSPDGTFASYPVEERSLPEWNRDEQSVMTCTIPACEYDNSEW